MNRVRLEDVLLLSGKEDKFVFEGDYLLLPPAVATFSSASRFTNLIQLWSYVSAFPTFFERIRKNTLRDLEVEMSRVGYTVPATDPVDHGMGALPPVTGAKLYVLTGISSESGGISSVFAVTSVENAQKIVDECAVTKRLWLLTEVVIDATTNDSYPQWLTPNKK